MLDAHRQAGHRIRFDWGPTGASALVGGPATGAVAYAVVVDVLSFTTTVSVAVQRGARVFPYRWRDDSAARYAAERDAVLAVGRLEALSGGDPAAVSLSPARLATIDVVPGRLVLPSPNGSTIAALLAGSGATVVGACLRDATAVAAWLAPRLREPGATLAVVAAGERWPDGSLRPAVEDLWGAGAVLAALEDLDDLGDAGPGEGFSPEARVAASAWRAVAPRIDVELAACAGARELVDAGFGADVDVAADMGGSDVVAVLDGEAFTRG